MAIISAASIKTLRARAANAAPRDAARWRKESDKIVSLLRRASRPNYGDVPADWGDAEGIEPERVTLLFVHEPPVEVGMPILESAPQPQYRPTVKGRGRAADVARAEEFFSQMGIARGGESDPLRQMPGTPQSEAPDSLFPLLDENECALSAYRRMLAEALDFGVVETWSVTTWDAVAHTWTRRLFHGTLAALRVNFPDWEEIARMQAAGIYGAECYSTNPGNHPGAPVQLVSAGHEMPDTPFLIRKQSKPFRQA